MIAISSCPACGGNTLAPFLHCTDYTVSRETFSLVTCVACALVITSPRPDEKDLGRYYQSSDYISHTNKASSIIDSIYLTARNFTLQWKLDIIEDHTRPVTKKILDYGCGTGDFLNKCQTAGWKTAGVEPSDQARQKAAQSTTGPLHSTIEENNDTHYDAITLWHVLEHVPDLHRVLDLLKGKLADSGTIFIAVPNHASADGQYYKKEWAGYDVPRHLWHFSRGNMEKLLQQHALRITDVLPMKLDAFYVSMLSEKYRHGKLSVFGMAKAFFKGLSSNLRAAKTGEYSSLIYIAKK